METEKEVERSLEEADIERQLQHAPHEPPLETVPHVITVPSDKVGHEKVRTFSCPFRLTFMRVHSLGGR